MFQPVRFWIQILGLVGQEYQRPQLLAALRDLRELVQVGGFDPKLYGVDSAGQIREFRPGTRDWTAPLAEHPMGPQAVAAPIVPT